MPVARWAHRNDQHHRGREWPGSDWGYAQVRLTSMFHLLAEEAKRQMSAPSVAFGIVAFGVLAFGLYVVLRQDVDK